MLFSVHWWGRGEVKWQENVLRKMSMAPNCRFTQQCTLGTQFSDMRDIVGNE